MDSDTQERTKLVSVRSVVGTSLDSQTEEVIIDLLLIDGSLLGVKLAYWDVSELIAQISRVGHLAGIDLRRQRARSSDE
jgi:hypothetical protein